MMTNNQIHKSDTRSRSTELSKNFTIENFQVKGINIEAGVVVVIVNMTWGINMRAGVNRQLKLGVVSEGAVLHACKEAEEFSEAIGRFPGR